MLGTEGKQMWLSARLAQNSLWAGGQKVVMLQGCHLPVVPQPPGAPSQEKEALRVTPKHP